LGGGLRLQCPTPARSWTVRTPRAILLSSWARPPSRGAPPAASPSVGGVDNGLTLPAALLLLLLLHVAHRARGTGRMLQPRKRKCHCKRCANVQDVLSNTCACVYAMQAGVSVLARLSAACARTHTHRSHRLNPHAPTARAHRPCPRSSICPCGTHLDTPAALSAPHSTHACTRRSSEHPCSGPTRLLGLQGQAEAAPLHASHPTGCCPGQHCHHWNNTRRSSGGPRGRARWGHWAPHSPLSQHTAEMLAARTAHKPHWPACPLWREGCRTMLAAHCPPSRAARPAHAPGQGQHCAQHTWLPKLTLPQRVQARAGEPASPRICLGRAPSPSLSAVLLEQITDHCSI